MNFFDQLAAKQAVQPERKPAPQAGSPEPAKPTTQTTSSMFDSLMQKVADKPQAKPVNKAAQARRIGSMFDSLAVEAEQEAPAPEHTPEATKPQEPVEVEVAKAESGKEAKTLDEHQQHAAEAVMAFLGGESQAKPWHRELRFAAMCDKNPEIADLLGPHMHRNFVTLQGSAGTGKTFTFVQLLAQIARVYPQILANTAVCAFTAKAIKRVHEVVTEAARDFEPLIEELVRGINFSTIHKLLEYKPVEVVKYNEQGHRTTTRPYLPHRHARKPLYTKLLVVEESSMLGLYLGSNLLNALPSDCLILMVGDLCQVQPIADLNMYARIQYLTEQANRTMLSKIHRYSGPIVVSANKMLRGEHPDWIDKLVVKRPVHQDADTAAAQIVNAISGLAKAGRYDPEQDIIITTQNKYALGQININHMLCPHVNPDYIKKYAIIDVSYGKTVQLHLGTRIIFTVNDYEEGFVNGTTGKITDIQPNPDYSGRTDWRVLGTEGSAGLEGNTQANHDEISFDALDTMVAQGKHEEEGNTRQASHRVEVTFEHYATGEETVILLSSATEIQNLQLGYACTVYKAQGSEYRNVFVIVHKRLRGMNREALYTAFTRTRGAVVMFIGDNPGTLSTGLKNQALPGSDIWGKIVNHVCKLSPKELMNGIRGQEDEEKPPAWKRALPYERKTETQFPQTKEARKELDAAQEEAREEAGEEAPKPPVDDIPRMIDPSLPAIKPQVISIAGIYIEPVEGKACRQPLCSGVYAVERVANCTCRPGRAPCYACTNPRISCNSCGNEGEIGGYD